MIGRGVFKNPYCFTDHTPTRKELLELLKMHLDLFEKHENVVSRALPYEPLKHFFKIYINNFPGAADFRAELMETHSVAEAREVLKKYSKT